MKYLGCVQVQDSRGMHICEQALLTLKAQKGKSIRGLLYVSGDGLRVVDDETKVFCCFQFCLNSQLIFPISTLFRALSLIKQLKK